MMDVRASWSGYKGVKSPAPPPPPTEVESRALSEKMPGLEVNRTLYIYSPGQFLAGLQLGPNIWFK